MLRKSLFFLVFIFFSQVFAEPQNIDALRLELRHYVEKGLYLREVTQATEHAEQSLKKALQKKPQKPAIVLDIDETALSNLELYREKNFNATHQERDAFVQKHELPAIAPTLKFFRFARRHNVDVFFITGRPSSMAAWTEKNLRASGFEGFRGLITLPASQANAKLSPAARAQKFKTEARKALEKQGYTILVNLGDQEVDLAGGHAAMAIKLPNPFYVAAKKP